MTIKEFQFLGKYLFALSRIKEIQLCQPASVAGWILKVYHFLKANATYTLNQGLINFLQSTNTNSELKYSAKQNFLKGYNFHVPSLSGLPKYLLPRTSQQLVTLVLWDSSIKQLHFYNFLHEPFRKKASSHSLPKSKLEFKPAGKASPKSATREATVKSKCILLPPTTKVLVETASTCSHTHIFNVLPSIISCSFIFIAENL
jgi:hypothetical protein